jgi:hypothetical protein
VIWAFEKVYYTGRYRVTPGMTVEAFQRLQLCRSMNF